MLMGIDIGGTKCALCVGDGTKIIEKVYSKTTDVENTLYFIKSSAEDLSRKYEIEAVGISCGGPLNSKTGVILSPPNLPGWDEIHITEIIGEITGCPTFLCNDANACALAEWLYGAGMGTKNMVFLTFGTGMGAGLILDGKLYEGTNGMAGEVGHIRLSKTGPSGYGKNGSFEGFCSGGGIARLGKHIVSEIYENGGTVDFCDREHIDGLNAKIIGNAAESGDKTAIAIYKKSAKKLGYAISILIDILNPEAIVIGSIYTRSISLFEKTVKEVIAKEALSQNSEICKVLPAKLTESIGDYAALAVAKNGLEEMKNV